MYTTKNRLPYASSPLYERPRLRPVTFVLNLDHFRREMLRPNMLFFCFSTDAVYASPPWTAMITFVRFVMRGNSGKQSPATGSLVERVRSWVVHASTEPERICI